MSTVTLRRTLDLDCDPDELWQLVTDEKDLARWLGREVELEARPGGRGRVVDDDGTVRHLVVRDIVDGERVTFSWWIDGDDASRTDVSLEIQTTPCGSRLLVTETAPRAAALTSSWGTRLISLWLSVCALARV